MPGFVSNPMAKMVGMGCIVVPSRIEPFGLVALEAHSFGKPVVGFYRSGVAEIIDHANTGCVVAHGALSDMAQAIIKLIRHPDIVSDMRQKVMSRAHAKFAMPSHI